MDSGAPANTSFPYPADCLLSLRDCSNQSLVLPICSSTLSCYTLGLLASYMAIMTQRKEGAGSVKPMAQDGSGVGVTPPPHACSLGGDMVQESAAACLEQSACYQSTQKELNHSIQREWDKNPVNLQPDDIVN